MSHGYLKSMRCRSKIAARPPPGGPARVLLTVMDARVSAQMPTGMIVRAAGTPGCSRCTKIAARSGLLLHCSLPC